MTKPNTKRYLALIAVSTVALLVLLGPRFGVNIPGSIGPVGLVALGIYVAFWATVIAAGIWLARDLGLFKPVRRSDIDEALAEVSLRYARGEITRNEYFQIREDLESASAFPDRN